MRWRSLISPLPYAVMPVALMAAILSASTEAVRQTTAPPPMAASQAQAPGASPALPGDLGEPYKGVTTNGKVITGLFPIRATGVTTEPVKKAAEAFLKTLSPEQRQRTMFPVNDEEWRKWYNVHRGPRQGVNFKELSDPQKLAAFGLLRASMSAKGFGTARDIMRLNGYLSTLVNKPEEYGEGLYFLTIMGEPSTTAPWGWQLDGHHLDVNYFVLRDQVVMTPAFMGSEPVIASSGPISGTAVLQDVQNHALAFAQALTEKQRTRAVIGADKDKNYALAQAFRDNLVLDYAGVRAKDLDKAQRAKLMELVADYVGNMDDGHAKVKMTDVAAHLDDTYFAWIGGMAEDSVFYYRIQSPVILIEFDHQTPTALDGPRGIPTRRHIHTVVRTPNGNDYGKDLLRQHYEQQHSNAR